MPRVGFEPTTPSFERAKTVYATDHAATVIDIALGYETIYLVCGVQSVIVNRSCAARRRSIFFSLFRMRGLGLHDGRIVI
jgi:hypothetical protein